MANTIVRIAIGAGLIAAVEAALFLAGPWSAPRNPETFGFVLWVTGILVLAISGLAALGPSVGSVDEIRPMHGSFSLRERRIPTFGTGGSGAVLVSSGTRSLWDAGAHRRLPGPPPKVRVRLGIGAVLFVVGGLLILF